MQEQSCYPERFQQKLKKTKLDFTDATLQLKGMSNPRPQAMCDVYQHIRTSRHRQFASWSRSDQPATAIDDLEEPCEETRTQKSRNKAATECALGSKARFYKISDSDCRSGSELAGGPEGTSEMAVAFCTGSVAIEGGLPVSDK
jgi:hypothetical protein